MTSTEQPAMETIKVQLPVFRNKQLTVTDPNNNHVEFPSKNRTLERKLLGDEPLPAIVRDANKNELCKLKVSDAKKILPPDSTPRVNLEPYLYTFQAPVSSILNLCKKGQAK